MKKYFSRNVTLFILITLLSGPLFSTPVLKTQDIYDNPHQFVINHKKWIIINYWATWCSFCVNEIPELNKLSKAIENLPAIFFAVNYDNASNEEQQAFAARHGIHYLMLSSNPFHEFTANNQISILPTTFIIAPDGRVQQIEGQLRAADVLAYLR